MKIEDKFITLKDGRKITLRSASKDDAQNILNHLKITHTESYKNMNQSASFWNDFSVETEANILKDFESSTQKFMLVAVSENKIVGGLGLVGAFAEFTKHNATLGMSIQNAFGNSGLGSAMMNYAIEMARKANFHRIDLSVRVYNLPGIALYEKVGFQRIGVLKDAAFIEGEYVDEFSYQKIL